MKLTIEEAKQRLRLPELARLLGIASQIPRRDGQLVACFWPERHRHGDRKPGFNFHDGLTRWKCFGCGEAGDGPDLIAAWLGFPPDEALKKFIALAGGEAADMQHGSGQRPPSPPPPASPPGDEWGDTAEKKAKRAKWPCFDAGAEAEVAALAKLRGFDVETVRFAVRHGWLRFCTFGGSRAWVLRSLCGRLAQIRKLDGKQWRRGEHEFKSWSLPGSCAAVPVGLETVTDQVRIVGMAEGGPDFLALLQLVIEQGRDECGLFGILGASVRIAPPVLERLRGKRVRIFAHADEAGRRAAAVWAVQLAEVGCETDAFDFANFEVEDANVFLRLPAELRGVEIMPEE